MREKYEKEIKDLESAEKDAKVKYCDTKSKLLDTEEMVISLRANVKQLEISLQEHKEVRSTINVPMSVIYPLISSCWIRGKLIIICYFEIKVSQVQIPSVTGFLFNRMN